MAKQSIGVYQNKKGFWEYRFVVSINGQRITRRKCTDDHGNHFLTKKDAMKAREADRVNLRVERTIKPPPARRTVKEVFEEFRSEGRKDRAYQTKRKQDSLWENHLCERFGKKYVDEISSAEVVDYLSKLYYDLVEIKDEFFTILSANNGIQDSIEFFRVVSVKRYATIAIIRHNIFPFWLLYGSHPIIVIGKAIAYCTIYRHSLFIILLLLFYVVSCLHQMVLETLTEMR